jgi:E3 ubiquitin-protein ligase TRIP12
LSDELPVTSTFEFVQSGSIKSLSIYLSNGAYDNTGISDAQDLLWHLSEVQSRLHKFASLALTVPNGSSANPLGILVEKLLDTLHMCYDSFPVMLSDEQSTRESMMIPLRYPETQEPTSLELKFRRSQREKELRTYNDVLSVDLFSTPDAIEPVLFPKICRRTDQEPAPKVSQCCSNYNFLYVNANNIWG